MLVDPMKAHPGDVLPGDGDPVLGPRVWEMHDVSEHPAGVEYPPDEPCSRERAVARLPISVRRDRTAEVEAGRLGSAYMASAVEFDRDAIIAVHRSPERLKIDALDAGTHGKDEGDSGILQSVIPTDLGLNVLLDRCNPGIRDHRRAGIDSDNALKVS